MKTHRRTDLRQTHLVVGDSVVKIDDRSLAINKNIKLEDRVLVPENKQSHGSLARKIVV
ncbi:hypothetical protein LCGC14_2603740 [marine sediment metagenome]|uniref:Uncharacterized protein n=1 Tax=marine sediment metagenome TaxID=412755 RepID=A0A0F9AVP7_9ZZZZ